MENKSIHKYTINASGTTKKNLVSFGIAKNTIKSKIIAK